MRGLVATVVASLAALLLLAFGCNPIFGIVSRNAGPTWCEQDAQATLNGYCDDFDRVTAATAAAALPASFHGSAQVTDSVASSPPNSLGLVTTAVPVDSGALVGNLVSFGPMATGNAFAPFSCQLDLQPSEIDALGGLTAGILGIGGELSTGEPEIVLVTVGNGVVTQSLEKLASPNTPATRVASCPPLMRTQDALTEDWLTLSLELAPDSFEGGVPEGTCTLSDNMRPGTSYILRMRLGPLEGPPTRVKFGAFTGLPYFVYGVFLQGSSPPVTFHVDNARCTMTPDGGP